MRSALFCAFTALALCMAPAASAQRATAQQTLFVTPMGEPYRADESGQRGIALWFSAADADRDGKMSRDEYMTEAMRFFAHLDANGDGSATSAESTALWRREAPEVLSQRDMGPPIMNQPAQRSRTQHNDPHDQGRGIVYAEDGSARRRRDPVVQNEEVVQGAARYGLLNDIEPVMTCDTDFNRRVTRDEFQTCADQRFTRIDLDHDGFFTPEEGGGPAAPVAPAATN